MLKRLMRRGMWEMQGSGKMGRGIVVEIPRRGEKNVWKRVSLGAKEKKKEKHDAKNSEEVVVGETTKKKKSPNSI